MKSITKMMIVIIILLSCKVFKAQIKNQKTETVHIYGNCDMCKSTIEKAGNIKKIVRVNWNKDTKMAILTYNAKKTNQDEILKRIALEGYDSDSFLAPDNTYNNLPNCCQYERKAKTAAIVELTKTNTDKIEIQAHTITTDTKQEVAQLNTVFKNYFAIKDALVKTNGKMASTKASDLVNAIKVVKMEKLAMNEHMVWMKVMKNLAFDAKQIAATQNISKQREYFTTLSKNMYTLIKVAQQETPTYLQHCPMANNGKGAGWLSKEKEIKNPYYGSQMLSCGKIVETINK